MPSEEVLERAYGGWYRPRSGRFAGPGDAALRHLRGRLARRLDRIAPPGPILDIGAGDGALLHALRQRGRAARGIDPNPAHADVHDERIEELAGDWAAIVFWHSLEHMRRAGDALDRAIGLLAPHGVLVVAIPNRSSLQAAAFGDSWFAIDYPRHLVHVPAATLLARLRERGLSIERVSHIRGGQAVFGWLYGLIGRLPGQPDLYDAIRKPEARRAAMSSIARVGVLVAAVALLPLAVACVAVEVALRRGGSVYVEARHV